MSGLLILLFGVLIVAETLDTVKRSALGLVLIIVGVLVYFSPLVIHVK